MRKQGLPSQKPRDHKEKSGMIPHGQLNCWAAPGKVRQQGETKQPTSGEDGRRPCGEGGVFRQRGQTSGGGSISRWSAGKPQKLVTSRKTDGAVPKKDLG